MPTFTGKKPDRGWVPLRRIGLSCRVVLVGTSPHCACNAGSLVAGLPHEVFVKGRVTVSIITTTFALEQGPDSQ